MEHGQSDQGAERLRGNREGEALVTNIQDIVLEARRAETFGLAEMLSGKPLLQLAELPEPFL